MVHPWDKAHDILDQIDCPGHRDRDSVYDRVNLAGDRLYLRPEGEPDTADLVGRINETCDRAGIAEGETVRRVEVLADQVRYLAHDKASLEAELAQLDAKPKRTEKVKLALAVISELADVAELKLAVSVLREAFVDA